MLLCDPSGFRFSAIFKLPFFLPGMFVEQIKMETESVLLVSHCRAVQKGAAAVNPKVLDAHFSSELLLLVLYGKCKSCQLMT